MSEFEKQWQAYRHISTSAALNESDITRQTAKDAWKAAFEIIESKLDSSRSVEKTLNFIYDELEKLENEEKKRIRKG